MPRFQLLRSCPSNLRLSSDCRLESQLVRDNYSELSPSLIPFQQFWPCGPPLLASLLSLFLLLLVPVVLLLVPVSPGAFAVLRALSEILVLNAELVLHLMLLKSLRFCCFSLFHFANVCSILLLVMI